MGSELKFERGQVWMNPDDEIMMITEVIKKEYWYKVYYVDEHGLKGKFVTTDKSIANNIKQVTRAPEWQPIEAAPKDGTCIIAYPHTDAKGVGIVTYTGRQWRSDYDREYPTHWMPLPQPPKEND